ncbi:MAG: carbamoyltransferase HypF, partial [Sandaracinaceae bacterium]|nr:carbamoyltransferase HypF [Sandaracinaceae bacterium]
GRRALAGLLVAAGREDALDAQTARYAALARAPRTPRASSVGRLFDAIAALTGVATESRFEGEAALRLEALAAPGAAPYPMPYVAGALDWGPMLEAILADRDAARVASRLHATLARAIREVALREGARRVALAGGCFANARLAEDARALLSAEGVEVLLPARVPPGDGGLALGQAWVAAHAARG